MVKYIFGNDFVDVVPITANGIEYSKLTLYGFFAFLWNRFYQMAFGNSTLAIVFVLWSINMFVGAIASLKCGKLDENGLLILDSNGKKIRSWDPEKFAQGCQRFALAWLPMILISDFIRFHYTQGGIGGIAVIGACSLTEAAIILTPMVSIFRGLSRITGFKRADDLATTIDRKANELTGAAKRVTAQIEASYAITKELESNTPPEFESISVMLVEDDLEQRKYTAFKYIKAGHNCTYASSVTEFKEMMTKFKTDTVVCDLHPFAEPVALFMRDNYPYIPLVAITALDLGSRVDTTALRAMGYLDIVNKLEPDDVFITKTLFFANEKKKKKEEKNA